MKLALTSAAALILFVTLSATAQGPGPRRDGNWQVTMEMDMPGMPQKMPPMTLNQCLTKADAEDPTKLAPQGRGQAPSNCKVSDLKTDGNKVPWSMQCEGLAVRIVLLAEHVGAVPWDYIQIPLLRSGVYQRVLDRAGLTYPPIDWQRVELAEARIQIGAQL